MSSESKQGENKSKEKATESVTGNHNKQNVERMRQNTKGKQKVNNDNDVQKRNDDNNSSSKQPPKEKQKEQNDESILFDLPLLYENLATSLELTHTTSPHSIEKIPLQTNSKRKHSDIEIEQLSEMGARSLLLIYKLLTVSRPQISNTTIDMKSQIINDKVDPRLEIVWNAIRIQDKELFFNIDIMLGNREKNAEKSFLETYREEMIDIFGDELYKHTKHFTKHSLLNLVNCIEQGTEFFTSKEKRLFLDEAIRDKAEI